MGRVVQDQSKEGNEGPSMQGLMNLETISLLKVKLSTHCQDPSDLSIISFSNMYVTWNFNICILDINISGLCYSIIVVQISPSRSLGSYRLIKQQTSNPCPQPQHPSLLFLCLGFCLLPCMECFPYHSHGIGNFHCTKFGRGTIKK